MTNGSYLIKVLFQIQEKKKEKGTNEHPAPVGTRLRGQKNSCIFLPSKVTIIALKKKKKKDNDDCMRNDCVEKNHRSNRADRSLTYNCEMRLSRVLLALVSFCAGLEMKLRRQSGRTFFFR